MTRSEGNAQSRAQEQYRNRLRTEGLARFEVIGRDRDKAMIRALAKRLSGSDADAERLRIEVDRLIENDVQTGASIYEAFRASPLVGAGISFARERSAGRKIEL